MAKTEAKDHQERTNTIYATFYIKNPKAPLVECHISTVEDKFHSTNQRRRYFLLNSKKFKVGSLYFSVCSNRVGFQSYRRQQKKVFVKLHVVVGCKLRNTRYGPPIQATGGIICRTASRARKVDGKGIAKSKDGCMTKFLMILFRDFFLFLRQYS